MLMEGYIKMDLQEIGCEDLEWIHLTQDRIRFQALINMMMDLWIP